ncbi:polysaccharide biosynthesis/export family protein [Rufibacter sediminis]|uniref:Polysaccharide biosynthesis/export family protein n=1 Tax=Rufibacter sediminis TaxID=2762756 RepID=A0ABR6VY48_9BACT|nr:polysaccharide biosynthesis/export family protein [Rufibacter sediminis]MBC3541854.1 polysaccharide biosynthesis/export family protein [Rufibacter sediminis]
MSFRKSFFYLLFFIGVVQLSSCNVYRQNVMFRTEGDVNADLLRASMVEAGRNYRIQPNDVLNIRIYTNKGEILVDPNNFLRQELTQTGNSGGRSIASQQNNQKEQQEYTVLPNGEVKVPMIGFVPVQGLTVSQADSLFQSRFETYYRDTFVYSQVISRRVIVLGAAGGKVIPLTNENINVVEVLALAGGIPENGKAQNIRLIRDVASAKPIVHVIDLSTVAGLQKASLRVQPNDVVYIEPVRRVFNESLRDVLMVVGAVSNVLTSYIVIKDIIN